LWSVLAQLPIDLFALCQRPLSTVSTPVLFVRGHGRLIAKRSWFVALQQITPVESLIATYNDYDGGQDYLEAALDDNVGDAIQQVRLWPAVLQSGDRDTVEGGCFFHSSCVGRDPSLGNVNTLVNFSKDGEEACLRHVHKLCPECHQKYRLKRLQAGPLGELQLLAAKMQYLIMMHSGDGAGSQRCQIVTIMRFSAAEPLPTTDTERRKQQAFSCKRMVRQLQPLHHQLGGEYVCVRVTPAGQGKVHCSAGLSREWRHVSLFLEPFAERLVAFVKNGP
jgi:hypothetical protein